MAHYMFQASYSQSAIKAMVEHPQDRAAAVKALIESTGGKMHSMFFAFGEHDVIILFELPDNVSAAAIGMAVGAAGSLSKFKTTVLFTTQEAMSAMTKAKSISYSQPK